MFISSVKEKKMNAANLKHLRDAVGERMRQRDVEEMFLKRFGSTTYPWEI